MGTYEAEAFERMGLPIDMEAHAAGAAQPPPKRRKWQLNSRPGSATQRPDNPPLYLMEPKSDVYGLGYDPYKNAEEFRRARQQQRAGSQATGHGALRGMPAMPACQRECFQWCTPPAITTCSY